MLPGPLPRGSRTGRHPLAGAKRGRDEVIALFPRRSGMGFKPEKLIQGVNDDHVVEAQWVADED